MDYTGDVSLNGGKGTSDDLKKQSSTRKVNEERRTVPSNELLLEDSTSAQTVFLNGHVGSVTVVETDGCYAITGGVDGRVYLWNISDSVCLNKLVVHTEPVTGLAFLTGHNCQTAEITNEKTVVTASKDGVIFIVPFEPARKVMSLFTDDVVTCLKKVEDHLIVVGTDQGKLICRQGNELKMFDSVQAHSVSVDSLAVENGSKCIATLDANSLAVCVWSLANNRFRLLYRFANRNLDINGHFTKLKCLTMRYDKVYVGDDVGSVYVLDWKSEKVTVLPSALSQNREICAILATDELLVTGTKSMSSSESHLNLLQLVDYKFVKSIECEVKQVLALAFVGFNNIMKFIVGGSKLAVIELREVVEESPSQESINSLHQQKTVSFQMDEIDSSYDTTQNSRKRVPCLFL